MADEQAKNLSGEQIKNIAVIILFSVVLSVVYLKLFWKPIADKKADAEVKISKIDAEIAKAIGITVKESALTNEIAELSKLEADASKRLPKDKKLPDLLRTLVGMAHSYHVNIAAITPQPQHEQTYYSEVPYQMTLSGGYNDVGRFVSVLATSQRVFTIRDMTMTASPNGISATFILVSFQYKG